MKHQHGTVGGEHDHTPFGVPPQARSRAEHVYGHQELAKDADLRLSVPSLQSSVDIMAFYAMLLAFLAAVALPGAPLPCH